MNKRIQKLIEVFNESNIEAFLVTNMKNIRYLTGFTGDTGRVIITGDKAALVVDGRFTEQAQKESSIEVIDYNGNFTKTIYEICKNNSVRNLGFESTNLSYSEYLYIKDIMLDIDLVPMADSIEKLRMYKDKEEIETIKEAARIADTTLERIIRKTIKTGMTERDIAAEIEYQFRKLGASGPSFNTIVVSGTRTSLPHGVPTDKKVENGDMITMDIGCVYDGYCSDITRTIFLGTPHDIAKKTYNQVLEVQKETIEYINEGMKCRDAEVFARGKFNDMGMEKYFVHSLGHGVGLDVHEMPTVSEKSRFNIEKGMVFTVEPGLYIPEVLGVRIEDMVYVGDEGIEVITQFPKEMIVI